MEMHSIVDILIGVAVTGIGWWLKEMHQEQRRVTILVNKTREEYATKMELRDDMNRMMEAMHRIEDKLDKLIVK